MQNSIETQRLALATLERWSAQELQQILADPTTSLAVLDFAASHLACSREELVEPLLTNPKLSDEIRDRVLATLASGAESQAASADLAPGEPAGPEETVAAMSAATPGCPALLLEGTDKSEQDAQPSEQKRLTLIQRINAMSAVQKIKLALTGSQDARMILVRDPNKIVCRCVLQSPKLTDSEIEAYASAKNVVEEVLRIISLNRKFMKNYAVMRALVNNPRAPIDITLPLLKHLNDKDMKALSLNRNVPEVLRNMSHKMIKQKEELNKPKGIKLGKH